MNRLILFILIFVSLPSLAQENFNHAEEARKNGNFSIAINHYKKAYASGNAIAAHWIGTFYYEGIGVPINKATAVIYFYAAANKGIIGSMVYLSNMYLVGDGVSKDCEKAEEWIKKFSEGSIPSSWVKSIENCRSSS